jgi:carboxymethylenebutenolidase
MCHDLDSHPPITPIAGGALDAERVVLTGQDGNRFLAFRARAAAPTGAGVVILPDVRGLHPFYEELAMRFAEVGVEALAIDYFGRTGGTDEPRDDYFEYMPHVDRTSWAGLSSDVRSAAADLRSPEHGAVRSLFTVGFCFGGRQAFVSPTLGLGLAGAIGFYGRPTGVHPSGTPAPVEVAGSIGSPILGLFGGADAGIPDEVVVSFDAALEAAGVDHRIVTYEGAPHSFFDRKADDFADASAAAWSEVLAFIRTRTAATDAPTP